jgi:hypothetical protein
MQRWHLVERFVDGEHGYSENKKCLHWPAVNPEAIKPVLATSREYSMSKMTNLKGLSRVLFNDVERQAVSEIVSWQLKYISQMTFLRLVDMPLASMARKGLHALTTWT